MPVDHKRKRRHLRFRSESPSSSFDLSRDYEHSSEESHGPGPHLKSESTFEKQNGHKDPDEHKLENGAPFDVDPKVFKAQWNGYPQGNFTVHLSWDEFNTELDGLKVDWAYNSYGTHKGKTSIIADNPEQGKRTYRSCIGSLQCDNPDCRVVLRPRTKANARGEQIGERCPCNDRNKQKGQPTEYRLHLVSCPNISKMVKWRDGVIYWNGISHNHEAFHHKKRLSPLEQKRTEALLSANPTATPAALRSGNTVSGESLLDISTRFITENVARNEVRKVRGPKPASADEFMVRFSALQQTYPNYVIAAHLLNGIVVISCQTQWMAERFIQSNSAVDGFSGSVTDAAHGWFAVATSLLITTSVFSPSMQRWVPALYSYSNGATAIHYEFHFLALMRSARSTKASLGGIIQDTDFDGVSIYSIIVMSSN